MPHSYCRHRFTTLKRWQSGDYWYVIQHCRWCDKWQRKTIEISVEAMKAEPKLVNEVYKVNDVGIKKIEDITEENMKETRLSNDVGNVRGSDLRKQSVEPANSSPNSMVSDEHV